MSGWIAVMFAYGERNQVLARMERAAQEHDRMVPWFKMHCYLYSLESDPRWNAFLLKIGMANAGVKTGVGQAA